MKKNKVKIEDYNFGSIKINGEKYSQDVEVRSSGEALEWWRDQSHRVTLDDIKRALEENPDVVVIGTGDSGRMKVSEEVEEKLKEEEIKLITDKTAEATKAFNSSVKKSNLKIIGLFHLTC